MWWSTARRSSGGAPRIVIERVGRRHRADAAREAPLEDAPREQLEVRQADAERARSGAALEERVELVGGTTAARRRALFDRRGAEGAAGWARAAPCHRARRHVGDDRRTAEERTTMVPSAASASYAATAVLRDTPSSRASSRDDGSR